MNHERAPSPILPALVMTPSDVSRLIRELEVLDEYMRQQKLRESGQPTAKLPKTTRMLDELAAENAVNLLDTGARSFLRAFLQELIAHAPIVHVSFAVDPSSAFLQKIVLWFRRNADTRTLVRVGLQPSIAAGCVVRTPNKYFDFSLRQHLQRQRYLLRDALMALDQRSVTYSAAAVQQSSSGATEAPVVPAVGQGVAI